MWRSRPTTLAPRRGTPLAFAVAGADGRVVSTEGRRTRPPCADWSSIWTPIVGDETKPVLVGAVRGGSRRSADRDRVRYLADRRVHPQRRPASQTIADVPAEQLDLILPRVAELDLPDPSRPGSACGAGRPRPLGATTGRRRARPPARGDGAAADRCPRPDGSHGCRADRDALRVLETEFSRRDPPLEQGDLRRRRSLSQPRQPSNSSRSWSSSGLPKGKRTKTGYSTDASVLEVLARGPPDRSTSSSSGASTRSSVRRMSRPCRPSSPTMIASTRPSTRRWPRPAGCPRRTRTCRTSRSGPAGPPDPARRSSPANPT